MYKKKIEEMAMLKSDLKEQLDKNQRLSDRIEILEKEKENNKNYQEIIDFLNEELSKAKDKIVSLELTINKQQH